MKLTIQNYQRLSGAIYNNRWQINEVKELDDRYIFYFKSQQDDETTIEVARNQCDDKRFMARYQNQWFFLNKNDFETPEKLIKAFKNF